MKLNGWQRLWVVVAVVWMLVVLLFSCELWPTPGSVPQGEVFMGMKADEGSRFSDYYNDLATQLGGTYSLSPLVTRLQHDKDFLAASTKDQMAYLSDVDPDFAKANPWDRYAYLAHITGESGPSAEIDGHTLQFVPGMSADEQDRAAAGFHASLKHILRLKRARFAGWAFALFAAPLVVLYALGWGIAWVRRGFIT